MNAGSEVKCCQAEEIATALAAGELDARGKSFSDVASGAASGHVCRTAQNRLRLSIQRLETAAQALELLKQVVGKYAGQSDRVVIEAVAESGQLQPLLEQIMQQFGGAELSIEFLPISQHDEAFAAYSEARRCIYVDELKQMTNAEYNSLDNNVELYQVTVNGQLAGGCRFQYLTTPEQKAENGLEANRDYLLLGKVFVLPRFRSIAICTFMMRCALRRHKKEAVTILSYAHLERYYAREFGFAPQRWFIPGLCVIMERAEAAQGI